jgi:hypothetical protein
LIQDFVTYLDIYNIEEVTHGDQIGTRAINMVGYESYKYNFLITREAEHTLSQEIFFNEIINNWFNIDFL